MSIKLIAVELYRLVKEAERLEKALAEAPPEKKTAIENELRKIIAERNRMREMLDGQKDAPASRKNHL